MKQQWLQWVGPYLVKYQALSQREKLLVLISGVVLILFVGFFNVLESRWLKQERLENSVVTLKADFAALIEQKKVYELHLKSDPNRELVQQKQSQDKVIEKLDNRLNHEIVDLIQPENMPAIMQGVLQQLDNVKVESVVTQDAKPLLQQESGIPNLYRHGLSLTLTGDYQSLYTFLAKAEQLPWQFHWQNFNFKVIEHPKSVLQVDIYTLSLEQGFIGL